MGYTCFYFFEKSSLLGTTNIAAINFDSRTMATSVGVQPLDGTGQPAILPSYASFFEPTIAKSKSIPQKPISSLHGEHIVQWDYSEVEQMVINEKLQYAVIGKFSYG